MTLVVLNELILQLLQPLRVSGQFLPEPIQCDSDGRENAEQNKNATEIQRRQHALLEKEIAGYHDPDNQ